MKKTLIALCLSFLGASAVSAQAAEAQGPSKVTFPSKDGLEVTADLYFAHKNTKVPFIVLFHQAGWSRGEYREIAPKLNEMGFNCMAVDQRSGGAVNGVENATHKAALAKGLATEFPDALPDMIAALELARSKYGKRKVIAWGSSYSSALVLKIAGTHPKLMDGVLSFSPGEYFERFGKSSTWIGESAGAIECPVWITSARAEKASWEPIFEKITKAKKYSFLPETKGNHGSRALWETFDDHVEYWAALESFLVPNFLEKKSSW